MKKLTIAIIGYGKMGKEIEKFALEKGHNISCIIDNENEFEQNIDLLKSSDVAIEFSTPASVIDNIKKCFDINLPIVTGTTGWHDKIDEIYGLCQEHGNTLFYASNFSLGVNILFELNKQLASMLNNNQEYSLKIEETHHTQKLDAPSGTAITLAKDILDTTANYKTWKLEERVSSKSEIPIKAIRKNNIFGTHEIYYDSQVDSIRIIHSAKSRMGFVKGALMAAEWVFNKKGIFTMQNLLGLNKNSKTKN